MLNGSQYSAIISRTANENAVNLATLTTKTTKNGLVADVNDPLTGKFYGQCAEYAAENNPTERFTAESFANYAAPLIVQAKSKAKNAKIVKVG